MSPAIGYFLRWQKERLWDIMSVETTQRHLQMLLIVSSFGESRRRANHSAAALLKSIANGDFELPACWRISKTISYWWESSGC